MSIGAGAGTGVPRGGTAWWYRVVVPRGGTAWWYRVVETSLMIIVLIRVSYKSILYCVLLYHTKSLIIIPSQMEHGDAPSRCKWQVSHNLTLSILK